MCSSYSTISIVAIGPVICDHLDRVVFRRVHIFDLSAKIMDTLNICLSIETMYYTLGKDDYNAGSQIYVTGLQGRSRGV
ncbi:hypothetical protein SAMN04488587_1037 [Methanococcoides vulcani]|uniref:Uncharacterized protein n=1 Tax=Methanococcoides vulcani TaxID=1353158 RepID=A0A1H9ZEP3_9EURY|nr:hypothetical protein SAMN04488587_1037 [Methanococcoides vulcani]